MRIPIVAPRRIRVVAAGLALIVASIAPASVLAVSPTNDNLATATVVGAFPFADTADISAATSEPGEPFGCASSGRTVWYTFSPAASGSVTASAATSTFEDAMLNVYTASVPFGMGDLTVVACGTYSHNPAVFAVHAGLTYYIQASDYYSGGGTLNITFTFEPPAPNDSFADAVPIGAIPFSDTTTNTAATSEAGEPHCGYGLPWGSVWYKFVPTESGSVTATTSGSWLVFSGSIFTTLGAYQGSSVDALTALACRSGPSILTLEVDAGSTYYFQAAGTSGPGTVTFRLESSPSPIADFYWNPSSPSTFDTVYFNDYSVDPGNAGFQTAHWEFGAGATADGLSASHQFANDGDYTVSMTTTTVDGRSASVSKVISVRTHDIGIAKLNVPSTARAGQTRTITVGVSNHRYPENGVVTLWKGTYPYDQLVGQLEGVNIPVQKGNKTQAFTFTYTFTAQDAAVGKVTFRASVGIWEPGIVDAYPGDNFATAISTRVTR